MGGKDSKPAFLTYEDACNRVSEAEMKRLKDAFKRSATLHGYMTKAAFFKEVLGDGVPNKMAEQLFVAFGGIPSKGLNFKDLLCGLVLLVKGSDEEKIKFLFGVYANEQLTHVQKEEMDGRVLAMEGQVPLALSDLFKLGDRVPYDYFRNWVLQNKGVTSLTTWLLVPGGRSVSLSNDLETPTFYQTLAGVTHLEETDIIELEKRYWMLKSQSKTGLFDLDTFTNIVCPPVPETVCEGLFNAFDENRDNHIDFKEMACGISACCRGPLIERQKFCFKVFDQDVDGRLNREELTAMIDALLLIRSQNKPLQQQASDGLSGVSSAALVDEILGKHEGSHQGALCQEDYLVWTVQHALPTEFTNLLFQICHIVLGLKPQNREDEGTVVMGWLERENRRGMQAGQTWYLIAIQWWTAWLSYISYRPSSDPLSLSPSSGSSSVDSSKKGHSRSGSFSLCPQFPKKTGSEFEVTPGTYSTLPLQRGSTSNHSSPMHNNNKSGLKYATLPHSATSSPTVSRAAMHRVDQPGNNHVSSVQSAGSTPSQSPRLNKRCSYVIPSKPNAIDNTSLVVPNNTKILTLTNEGGKLRRDKMLARGRDFELVPESVWKALSAWYGGNAPSLPRNVIRPTPEGQPELELYPIFVKLMRHQTQQARPAGAPAFTGMLGGISGMMANTTASFSSQQTTPRRYSAYTAAFSHKHTLKQVYDFLVTRLRISREDMRLWKFVDETNMTLLEEEEKNMEDCGITDVTQILIEVRNKDLTWPEEMSQLAKNKSIMDKTPVTTECGATGLNNLGNTCFMNSALQCVSNTRILTDYFNFGFHLYELNRENPLGMKGHIAQRYGDLVKDLWRGTAKCVAPIKLRMTIGKYAPRFNGFQQHDSQELLAFLLDGLHEDLNRVHKKPYVELKDSDNRPDDVVAKEAWDNHMLRNRSIVVDLLHGQLKSCVRCRECSHTSVRFDPFTFLSLPLPMESCLHVEILLMRLDGSVPIKYGLRLNTEEKYRSLKRQLSDLSGIPQEQLLLAEVFGAIVKSLPQDCQKIKALLGGNLYAYELPNIPPITPMSQEDERLLSRAANGNSSGSSNSSSGSGGLSQIQRMHNVPARMLRPDIAPSADSPTHALVSTKVPNGSVVVEGVVAGHQRNTSLVSSISNNNHSSSVSPSSTMDGLNGYVIAVHRKMMRQDMYFLSSQKSRPSVFGTPLLLPCEECMTQQDLYQYVWTMVARLVSPLPPSEALNANHAQDCDDSLGYEYPFSLKVVQQDGMTCAHCPWFRFCRGCNIECNQELFNFSSSFIAVDWEPTALHLRYQTSQERVFTEHQSVEEARRLQTEPIDLDTCLRAFTKEEELGEDELYYCSKCKTHRRAVKKLDIWRLPPILIIHLKRFQLNNNRWVKSQKIVKFPHKGFDPTSYIVPRLPMLPQDADTDSHSTDIKPDPIPITPSNPTTKTSPSVTTKTSPSVTTKQGKPNGHVGSGDTKSQSKAPSGTSSKKTSNKDTSSKSNGLDNSSHSNSKSGGNHGDAEPSGTEEVDDYTDVQYDLYAMSCHIGMLGGGHYIAYARNPNNKWYIYNDSSCKELVEDNLDNNSAYILFYERRGTDYEKFLPDVNGKEPDTADIEDEIESDYKKMCVLQ